MGIKKFDILVESILREGEILANAEDANNLTSYDIITGVINRMVEDPRDLLPPVDLKKFIVKDPKEKDGFKFTWRYGSAVYVEIKVTPDNIYIYDIKSDKVLFSTPTTNSPVHSVENIVFIEIEKLITADKQKDELGVSKPLELGDINTSALPGAEREADNKAPTSKTSEYLKGLK